MALPIDYPTVEIGGVTYLLKFGGGAQLRMDRLGRAFYSPNIDKREGRTGMVSVTTYTWLVAMAGLQEPDGKWKPLEMSPDEVADLLPPSEHLERLTNLVLEAIKKAQPVTSSQVKADTPEQAPVQ